MDVPVYEEFVKRIKFNLWVAGIPYGDPKVYFRFYISYVTLQIMIGLELTYFVSKISSENALELSQLAPCICVGVLTVLKITAITWKRKTIYKLTECLSQLHGKILKDDQKKNLVKKNLILLNVFIKYFLVLNAVLISVYNFSTLIIMTYHYFANNEVIFPLPYPVYVPFATDSWLPWTVVYVYSVICGFTCVLFYTIVDGLYFVLTSHICGNFSIISDRIKCLDVSSMDNLKEIIKDHQYILRLAEDLEDIFTAPNLFNVLFGSLEICALGFNITIGSWGQTPACLLFLSSVLLQILMMSVFGENIIRESSNIGDSAFLCNWYNMDEKTKKLILMIIVRSKKPARLTAYKFSVISYESFTKILSTSWSYLTILRTMYAPAEVNRSG
ncbi:putative odorant receptor 92a [Trichoplusia ni]|uniref:Odorant receptor n=1 Tax=Trichoplusia ni TaxID=7111 RepID=A0A7E5WKJ8_TRINI|nr:putative odorant receptor 92a [Trichoplusia ni]